MKRLQISWHKVSQSPTPRLMVCSYMYLRMGEWLGAAWRNNVVYVYGVNLRLIKSYLFVCVCVCLNRLEILYVKDATGCPFPACVLLCRSGRLLARRRSLVRSIERALLIPSSKGEEPKKSHPVIIIVVVFLYSYCPDYVMPRAISIQWSNIIRLRRGNNSSMDQVHGGNDAFFFLLL